MRILAIWPDFRSLRAWKWNSASCPVMKFKSREDTGGLAPYRFISKTKVSGMALATGECHHKDKTTPATSAVPLTVIDQRVNTADFTSPSASA